jgi:hypothetical protein
MREPRDRRASDLVTRTLVVTKDTTCQGICSNLTINYSPSRDWSWQSGTFHSHFGEFSVQFSKSRCVHTTKNWFVILSFIIHLAVLLVYSLLVSYILQLQCIRNTPTSTFGSRTIAQTPRTPFYMRSLQLHTHQPFLPTE